MEDSSFLSIYGEDVPARIRLAIKDYKNYKNYPIEDRNYMMYLAAEENMPEVIELLLTDPDCDPGFDENAIINQACDFNHIEIVKMLLKDPRVDPGDRECEALFAAIDVESPELLDLLLNHPGIKLNSERLLWKAAECRDPEMFDRIIKVLNPGDNDNQTLYDCCRFKFKYGVQKLLADPRCTPDSVDNSILIHALLSKNIKIIKMLLNDPRIDLNKNKEDLILAAKELGDVDVMNIIGA